MVSHNTPLSCCSSSKEYERSHILLVQWFSIARKYHLLVVSYVSFLSQRFKRLRSSSRHIFVVKIFFGSANYDL